MKFMALVRHGNYNSRGLTSDGQEQIGSLGDRLKGLLNGSTVAILTSPTRRAVESADILARVLDCTTEVHDVLESGGGVYPKCDEVLALVHSWRDSVDAVILVTHLEYTEDFPRYFFQEEFRVRMFSTNIPKGSAYVIDCHAKTMVHLEPSN